MSRDRRLQRAIDTINIYGGLKGAADVEDATGIWVPNLSKGYYKLQPEWWISRHKYPVYLPADIEEYKRSEEYARLVKRRAERAVMEP